MAYASVEDVKSRWISQTIPPDSAVIEQYLSDASLMIDSDPRLGDFAKRVKDDSSLADKARFVCVSMVLRCLSNPENVRHVQEMTGSISSGVTYASETLGGLRLTDIDLGLLRGRGVAGRVVSSVGPHVDTQTDPYAGLFT